MKNRYEFVGIIEVVNSNPNGDPDAGNSPRQWTSTGIGIMSSECLKRKIRNAMDESEVLYKVGELREEILKIAKVKQDTQDICNMFLDVRAFGGIGTTKGANWNLTGPIQLTPAESVVPIMPVELCISSSGMHAKGKDTEEKHTLGRKQVVPHAVYVFRGSLSPALAKKTGLTEADFEKVIDAIRSMFVNDKSAARPDMRLRGLHVFKHATAPGNAPAYKVWDTVNVTAKVEAPVKWDDYTVTIGVPPEGVTVVSYEGLM